MKKNLAKKITLSILAGAILLSSNVVWAAEDIKNGDDIIWGYFSYDGGFYLREPSNNLDGVVPDGTYNENFYGAFGFNGTDATGGKVTINGGTFGIANSPVSIRGGFSDNGNATDNAVTISGGSVTGDVFGGCSGYGGASNNTVTISGNANLENADTVHNISQNYVKSLNPHHPIEIDISPIDGQPDLNRVIMLAVMLCGDIIVKGGKITIKADSKQITANAISQFPLAQNKISEINYKNEVI